ncbi:quinol:cytochrome C oxidoreductase [Flavobacterium sp.]|uniref:quinol:cytochrome C oxidoreductase n=1 Tax=Flavobacterium sp. TaxID=239 RepID=UPI0037530539
MYTFSSKLKNLSLILMVLGALGIGYGFFTAPKNTEEVEAILASGHGEHHATPTQHEVEKAGEHVVKSVHEGVNKVDDSTVETLKPHNESVEGKLDSIASHVEEGHVASVATSVKDTHEAKAESNQATNDAHTEHAEHVEHVFHQLQNKPWAALYVAALFFMLISLGVLAFYAIQHAAQAGWSPVLFRVMEALTSYLVPGAIIVYVLLVLSSLHFNHLFVWMDPEVVKHDELIQGKSGYLNVPFFLIRAAIFMGGWIFYRQYTRKNALLLDETNDASYYKKNFKASAAFLAFFLVSESMMSWDWIMSVDPHWYSTLFGWYVFASFFVSGITVIALTTLYLKSKGYLENVNNSHFHDLAKFMFGISVFWTYLWFSQFMLMWYANIPEEVTYFKFRIEHYNLPFFGMVAMNFVFPILILINTDFKRVPWIISMAGIVILCGHYLDFHNMIYPATVGDQWFIGVSELSSIFFFLGLFIYVVFTTLSKQPLLPKGNPLIEESKHFHY